MPGRDDLLAAAKQCLVQRGWGATTVRDIAAAAGMSHASIGYHFGSRDALMTEALIAAVGDLSQEVDVAHPEPGSAEQWTALLRTVRTHRELWLAQLEAVRHAQQSPEIRRILVEGQRRAQAGLGSPVAQALLVGLAVQALVDPDVEVDAAQVADAVRTLEGSKPKRTRPAR